MPIIDGTFATADFNHFLFKTHFMKVAILNFDNVVSTSVTGPYDILTQTNALSDTIKNLQNTIYFEVEIVNFGELNGTSPVTIQGKKISARKKIYDLIIVPSIHFNNVQETVENEKQLIRWLKKQYTLGAEVVTLGMGAFLLAATGVLDNHRITTHWIGTDLFKKMFPSVILVEDKIIIDEHRIYSCGTGFSFASFMIYLVEKFAGHDLAVIATKTLLMQTNNVNQNGFPIFNLQHNHEDNEIKSIQDYIEKQYAKKLSIQKIANKFNLSNRSLIRRFSNATGNTPLEYIQRVRIEAAKRLLEKGNEVKQVCLKTGYEDFSFFRKVFKRHTGHSPQEYKKNHTSLFTDSL